MVCVILEPYDFIFHSYLCADSVCAQVWSRSLHFPLVLARRSVCAHVWSRFLDFPLVLARRFSLRACMVPIPILSSRTCAQIQFARKYGPDSYTFLSYLRADSVCAQVWSRFLYFPLVLARRFGLRASITFQ